MTYAEAIRILKEAGESWTSTGDLFNILSRTYDATIKVACERIINFKRRERRAWIGTNGRNC